MRPVSCVTKVFNLYLRLSPNPKTSKHRNIHKDCALLSNSTPIRHSRPRGAAVGSGDAAVSSMSIIGADPHGPRGAPADRGILEVTSPPVATVGFGRRARRSCGAGALVGWDGCEVRLCDPCLPVCPRVSRISYVSVLETTHSHKTHSNSHSHIHKHTMEGTAQELFRRETCPW